jgi:hypothetical protein
MRDPNFSESQLQQAVNSAYMRHIFETKGQWVFVHVPSLFDEFDLGWDSAFYFPWLHHPPENDHYGCNFFIQYKLSVQLTSAGAKQWGFWNAEYFRFKIPHSTRDANGTFIDDYHQWDRLNELADNDYPTFYATNSTLSKDELISESNAGTLLNTIPMLDVRSVASQHKLVTFTPSSAYFLMHSEKEKIKKHLFSNVTEILSSQSFERPRESNAKLLKILSGMEIENKNWHTDLSKIYQITDAPIPTRLRPWVKRSKIANFVLKHIGVNILWLPKNG